MKLDRNINPDGTGKYALRELLKLEAQKDFSATTSVSALAMQGIVDHGGTPETDFFVIRLKDKYAAAALTAYANAANKDDPEYAAEIHHLAQIAANYPNKRKPD